MSVFAIADLHLSLGEDKPMDVFSGWDHYVERLSENWKQMIQPTDSVVIAGDISWGMSLDESAKDFEYLNALPGEKFLLKGNHDYWWSTRKKMEEFFSQHQFDTLHIVHNNAFEIEKQYAVCGTRGWFLDAEEDTEKKIVLREVGRLKTSIQEAKTKNLEPIVFLHYPPVFGGEIIPEIWNVLLEEEVKNCFYGHIHGQGIHKAFEGEKEGVNLKLISCDALQFKPLKIF